VRPSAEAAPEGLSQYLAVRDAVTTAAERVYRYSQTKDDKQAPKTPLRTLTLWVPRKQDLDAAEQARLHGAAIGEGVTLARELGNLPGNLCTPSYLADQARELAARLGRLEVDDDPQFLKDVGGAGCGRGCPVAVLDNGGPRCGADEGGHRGDVDRLGLVTAGADHIKDDPGTVGAEIDQTRMPQHHGDQGIDLIGCLALGTQRGHEAGDLGRRGSTSEDLGHGPGGGRLVEIDTGQELAEHQRPGDDRGTGR